MATTEPVPSSPRWSPSTKLVIGLAFVVIVIALLYIYRTLIGPLLLAIVLAYLLHPLIGFVQQRTGIAWRTSVNLIYLIFVILLAGFLTLSGLAIVNQIQSLIRVVDKFIDSLPEIAADLSTRVFTLDPLPYQFSLGQFDLPALTNQLINALQPMLGRVGSLVGSLATSAVITLGWGLFILVISYFLLAETRNVSTELISVDLPGYKADLRRLGIELKIIWNAFLRGQLVIFILVVILYSLLMAILGVRYGFAIAILAGLARFVPYVGPLVTWVVIILVALLQGSNYFGLVAWQFAILAVGLSLILDQVLDNLITPRFLGQTLGVHPATVLIAALVLANLIGLIGLVLAAPVVATLKLVGRYTVRKMLDLDPWTPVDKPMRLIEFPWSQARRRVKTWWRSLRR